MDFTFDEEQQAIAGLATQLLTDKVTHERLKDLTAQGIELDDALWRELAATNLLGICLPEADGGSGFGILEACFVLEQIGRTVAAVPYLATVVSAAMPVARFGTAEQRARLLPGVIDGTRILTAAPGDRHEVTATPEGDGWRLDGDAWFVPWGSHASHALVPARTSDGAIVIAIVELAAKEVSLESLHTTARLPESHLHLRDLLVEAGDLLAGEDDGAHVLHWIDQHTTVGLCAVQAGVSEGALRLTATYTSERKQFGSPIATFQAVAHRAADAYIDTQGIRFTMWQAAWRLGEGLPAADAIDIATYWATEGGQRVAHAAQHLHGGIGVDTDYPLHRYFRWAKQIDLTSGGPTAHLLSLGRRLAAEQS